MDVRDEVVLAAHDRLGDGLNDPTQAYSYWGALGVICSRRPHLLERLLCLPMDRIYWYWGATNVQAVWEVILGEEGLLATDERVQQPCFEAGALWLRQELPKHEDLISQELTKLDELA